MCLRGSSGVATTLLKTTPSDRLKALVVWVPKRGGKRATVPLAMTTVPDARARHYWDESGAAMKTYREVLGLNQDAWDVYLLYGPEARWDGPSPPKPVLWRHQLADVHNVPCLDAEEFTTAARSLLGRDDR